MRLYYLGIEIVNDVGYYKFIFDGKDVKLRSREARELVSSVPKEERDCKVAFNQITLKSVVRKAKSTAVSGRRGWA